jgi:hypothetical protein
MNNTKEDKSLMDKIYYIKFSIKVFGYILIPWNLFAAALVLCIVEGIDITEKLLKK